MNEDRSIQLPKSFHQRILELTQSLQIIRDSLDLIKKGKSHQIIPLYGQLRSLLTEKSKKNPELLFEISDKLNFPLELYYLPDIPFPSNIPKPHFSFISPEISIKKEKEKQEKISLIDFLETKIITLKEVRYSVRELINSLANMAGGAHYSSKIPRNYAELFTYGLYGINEIKKIGITNPQILNNLIFQIGNVIFNLGLKILKQISEFEYYTHIYIPQQKLENEAFLMDLNYGDTLMRTSILFDKDFKLHFYLRDANGVVVKIKHNDILPLDEFYLINVSYGIGDKLETRIEIFINNLKVGDECIDNILAFRNDLNFFEKYFNRSTEDSDKGLTFGMLQHVLYSKVLLPIEKRKVTLYIQGKSNINDKLVWFTKGNFGCTESGKRNMEMQGVVKYQTIKEFKNNNGS